ncbi:MAG: histidinol-phosphate transaminase [Elusimicrobiota bacterium]
MPKPREIIKDFLPYVPGMSLEEVRKQYGLDSIVKLASNENLWGTSSRALDELTKELENIHIYPQSEPAELKKRIADRFSVPEEAVITGNGTDEIIELISRTFLEPGDKIVISKNSFIRYRMAGIIMDAEVTEVPQKDHRIDIKGLAAAVDKRTKIIYIDNPCNPTGTYVDSNGLNDLIRALKDMAEPPLLVLDEAYYEYVTVSEYSSGMEYLKGSVPVMVLRTFSKIYGLAGLRIGYAVGDPGIISLINRIRPPFNTNRLAQAAATGAFADNSFVDMVREKTEKEKKYLYGQLDSMDLQYVRSQTNFILVRLGSEKVRPLCEFLLQRGIVLRPLAGYDLDDYIRVTVGRHEHNTCFIEGLMEFLNTAKE